MLVRWGWGCEHEHCVSTLSRSLKETVTDGASEGFIYCICKCTKAADKAKAQETVMEGLDLGEQ